MWIIGDKLLIILIHCGKLVRNKIYVKDMKIMKKLLAMTAVSVMICSALTGCGNNDKSSSSDMNGGIDSTAEVTENKTEPVTEVLTENNTEDRTYDHTDDRNNDRNDETRSDNSSNGYVGDVVDGVESAGEDIIDGVGDAADDIISGVEGDNDSSSR